MLSWPHRITLAASGQPIHSNNILGRGIHDWDKREQKAVKFAPAVLDRVSCAKKRPWKHRALSFAGKRPPYGQGSMTSSKPFSSRIDRDRNQIPAQENPLVTIPAGGYQDAVKILNQFSDHCFSVLNGAIQFCGHAAFLIGHSCCPQLIVYQPGIHISSRHGAVSGEEE